MNIHAELARDGIVIYKEGDWWFAHKGDPCANCNFKTYEEAMAHAVTLLNKPEPLQKYSVTVRYNRGLGVEYLSLPPIEAKGSYLTSKQEEADSLAQEVVASYFKKPGLEKAVVNEIRVRPITA